MERWNPTNPIQVTPEEYEKSVLAMLREHFAPKSSNVDWVHRQIIEGSGGEFEIDIVGHWTLLGGLDIRVLVECKRYKKPVERDDVLAFESKLRGTASHKGIMFSTSGFQRGALKYAASVGIATIVFRDKYSRIETRSAFPVHIESIAFGPNVFGGELFTAKSDIIRMQWVEPGAIDPLVNLINA